MLIYFVTKHAITHASGIKTHINTSLLLNYLNFIRQQGPVKSHTTRLSSRSSVRRYMFSALNHKWTRRPGCLFLKKGIQRFVSSDTFTTSADPK